MKVLKIAVIVFGLALLLVSGILASKQPNECKRMGDVTNDGLLTGRDVTCMQSYILYKPTPSCHNLELCGDLNGDGAITGSDIVILRNTILFEGKRGTV